MSEIHFFFLFLGVSIIPVIIQMLSLPWCPETPHHLIMHDEDEAEACKGLYF